MHHCQSHRDQWLENRPGSSSLEHACEECATWEQRTRTQIQLLQDLPNLTLPATHASGEALIQTAEEPVEQEPCGLDEQVERCLGELQELQAPEVLAQRLQDDLRDRALDQSSGLASLAAPSCPSVLDRLVAEELASPIAHQNARLVGRMERLRAPAALDERVTRELAEQGQRPLAGSWKTWVGFLAAGLLGWVAVRSLLRESPEQQTSRPLVHVQSLAEYSSLSQGLVEILGVNPHAQVRPANRERR